MSHVSVRGEQSNEDELAALESLTNLAETPPGQSIAKTGANTFENVAGGSGVSESLAIAYAIAL